MPNKSDSNKIDSTNSKRDELFAALSSESDRGVVMVSAAFLDDTLEALLRERFSIINKKPKKIIDTLFNGFGPLSTFSAKIKMAYAVDLIEKWLYQDLETLRKLRNEFAHSVKPASFDSDEVKKITEKFKGADHAVIAIEKQKTRKTKKKKSTKKSNLGKDTTSIERARTIMTVSYIGGHLFTKTEILKTEIPPELKLKIMSIEHD